MSSSVFSRGFAVRYVAVSLCLAGLAVGAVAAVLWLGLPNFSADRKTSRAFYNVVHGAFKASVAHHGRGIPVPATVDLDDPGFAALGARHYAQTCARCHGAPGRSQNPQVLAMEPAPQYLPAVADQFSDGELYWIVRNGVMMSGMPAWPADGRADEPWAVVAFLRQIAQMSPEAYAQTTRPDPTDGPPIPFGALAPERAAWAQDLPYPPEEHAATPPSSNFADYAALGLPVAQCAACHGADGTGAPTGGHAPNLAILSERTIGASLRAYASGERASGFMQVAAAQLSDRQIDGLAAYYAGLPDRPLDAPAAPAALVDAGRAIATRGLPGKGVAACLDCHGGGVTGDGPAVTLAAQSRPYLQSQLELFRSGARQGGTLAAWSPMNWEAHALDDQQIAAVAAYFSALAPDARPAPAELSADGGKRIVSAICAECHGEGLAGVPSGEYPNLTLQRDAYVLAQFGAFHENLREVERMKLVVNDLSDEEMATMAAYIDALPPAPREGEPVAGDRALGQRIATEGLPGRDVPACLSCHGEDASDRIPMTPRLHGQYPKYLLNRLHRLAGTEAGGDALPGSPMPPIASTLSDEERQAVAAWFGAQEPLPK